MLNVLHKRIQVVVIIGSISQYFALFGSWIEICFSNTIFKEKCILVRPYSQTVIELHFIHHKIKLQGRPTDVSVIELHFFFSKLYCILNSFP